MRRNKMRRADEAAADAWSSASHDPGCMASPPRPRSKHGAARRMAQAGMALLLAAALLAVTPTPAAAHRNTGWLDIGGSPTEVTEGQTAKFKVCRSAVGYRDVFGILFSHPAIYDWRVNTSEHNSSYTASQADFQESGGRSGSFHIRHLSWHCDWLPVAIEDDNIVEPTESYQFQLTKVQIKRHTDDGLGTVCCMTSKIIDNDGVLSVSDVTATEGSPLTFTVSMDDSVVPGGHTVTPTLTYLSAETADISVSLQPIRFSGFAGESHQVTVPTLDDKVAEGDETILLTVTSSNTNMETGTASGTGTITDNDEATITVSDATGDEGYEADYTVSLGDVAVEQPFTVTVTPKPDTTGSKPAKPFGPVPPPSGPVTPFPSGRLRSGGGHVPVPGHGQRVAFGLGVHSGQRRRAD